MRWWRRAPVAPGYGSALPVRIRAQEVAVLRVLLADPGRPRWGVALAEEAGRSARSAMAWLEGAGWLESAWAPVVGDPATVGWLTAVTPGPPGRGRHRYYRLTGDGARAARAAVSNLPER